MAAAIPLSALATSDRWQSNFLSVLPAVKTHAQVCFRRLRPEARDEAVAETVARAFVDYGHLAKQRRLAQGYPSTLASYAVQRVRGHRGVGVHQTAKDVLSPVAQKKHGFALTTLTPWDATEETWREAVVESRRVTPAEHVAFSLDFAAWLKQWSPRQRKVINALAAGHRAMAVAEKFGVSQGRVSQWRRRYQKSWEIFQGESGGKRSR